MIQQFKYTETEKKKLLNSMTIIVDTREQKNTHIVSWLERKKKPYIVKKLNHGDYSFFIPANEDFNIPRDLYFDSLVCIERKAHLEELAGNFGSVTERSRIEKELATYTGKMKMLIEESQYQDIRDGNYKTKLGREAFINTLHSWEHKWGMSFNFIPNKEDTPLFMYLYLKQFLRNYLR